MNRHDLHASQVAERRWAILSVLYQERWAYVSEAVLAAELGDEGYTVTRDDLHRDLNYLQGKLLVEVDTSESGSWRSVATALGADYAEGTAAAITGVARPEASPSIRTHQLREARWRIIAVLNINGHRATTERSVLRAINDVDLSLSETELRREGCYLERLGLVESERQEALWLFRLTPAGTDVAEYAIEAPSGIIRPVKYWGR